MTPPIPWNEVYMLMRNAIAKYNGTTQTHGEFDDLVQMGMERLLNVLHYYDPKKGKFSTFLYMQAKWAIWRQKVTENHSGRLNWYLSKSLDYINPQQKENDPLMMFVEDKKHFDEDMILLESQLTPEERFYLDRLILNPMSMRALGEELGVSEKSIRIKKEKLVKRLKKLLNDYQ